MNEDLNKWFKEKWVNIGKKVDGKHPPCGTSGDKSGYAKCVPAAKAAGMSKKEKESATRRKRAAQNAAGRGGSDSKGQGKTPIYVSTKPKNEEWSEKYKRSIDCNNPKGFSQRAHCQGKKKNETMSIEEKLNLFLEKNCPTDAGKWAASKAAAKAKFDVYPSAYANGWAAKNYKSKGGGWRTCNESLGELNALHECWDGYREIGGKMKNGKMVPNCVPVKENIKDMKLKSLMPINAKNVNERIDGDTYNADSEGEEDFTKHHATSMYAPDMGYGAEPDTYDFDDLKDTKPGYQNPSQDKDVEDRGYEPVKSKKINEQVNEVEEYDVENGQDMKEFVQFMREYTQYLAEANCPCVYEAEYQGRKVQLGKPMQGDVKKFKVYVKNDKGNVVKVNFGDPNMRIKKSNPERRKSFRARHNCDTPGPRWKARYWSCRKW